MSDFRDNFRVVGLLDAMGRLRRNAPEKLKQKFRKLEVAERSLVLLGDFTKSTDTHKFTCLTCKGTFSAAYNNVVTSKRGCTLCSAKKKADNRRGTFEDFAERAVSLHSGKYEYPPQNFISQKLKVRICCKLHGEFLQTPDKHLAGQGCPACKTNSDAIYLWKVLKYPGVYKIGITTHSRGDYRIKHVANVHSTDYELVSLQQSTRCHQLEAKILATYPRADVPKLEGYTEMLLLTDAQVVEILEKINN